MMTGHARLPRHLPGRTRTAALTVLAALCAATGVTLAGAPRPEPLGAPIKEPDYKLTASAGLAGHARLGWVPVYVAIDARRDFDGDLVVRLRDQFAATSARGSLFEARRQLKLAAGSKTEYHVYIRHDTPSLNQAVVEVFLESGKPIRNTLQGLSVQLAGRGDYLLCVVSDKPNLLRTLAQRRTASGNVYNPSGKQERQFSVAQPALAELPDRVAGYNDVDFLVLYQTPFERLSKAQQMAMTDYLWRGGCVVLCARDGAWFRLSEVQALAAINQVSTMTREEADGQFRTLINKYGGFSGEASGSVVHKFSIPGSHDDKKSGSFAEVSRGLGTVLVWRLDPDNKVIATWPGMLQLWTDLAGEKFAARPTDEAGGLGLGNEPTPLSSCRDRAVKLDLARERSVSGALIVFLVVLYLVLVGPVNYFALRRLDMRALAIVTLPLLAAIFVLLNFALGYLSRGVITSSRRVTVAVAASGSARADCVTWHGLFPASSMLADLSTDSRGLLTPLAEPTLPGRQPETFTVEKEVRREERFILERYPLRMWQMFYFLAESTRPLGGAMKLLDRGNSFEVTNGSPLKLKDCFVIAGPGGGKERGNYKWLGELAPQTAQSGTLELWSQRQAGYSERGGPPPPLPRADALKLWMDGRLNSAAQYTVSEGDARAARVSGRQYTVPGGNEGFAAQAAQVLEHDPRLGRGRMMLFARIEDEELEPLRLDGSRLRGDNANILVVVADPRGGGQDR
jgi:hypothetical protein